MTVKKPKGRGSRGGSGKQPPALEYLFHPQSVAIVGVSTEPRTTPGGRAFLETMLAFGFKGKIYPINPKGGEILGLKAYPDILSLPQTPDYVICSLPGSLTLQLIKDCAAKGVKAISLYTAGFSETGEEGRQLEQELVELTRQGGIQIIGPNCLGIYCPSADLSFNPYFSKEPGCVGLLCQSGGNSIELTFQGGFQGIRFSKVISYGNAAGLDEVDLLEYFAEDAETEIIAIYIEGVKRGQRFLEVLTETAKVKPVIILKGGRTEAGIGAAASHTGSLTSSKETWDTLCRQAGAIQVYSSEEMLDLIVAFLYMKPPKGRRVGIVGVGGGVSVLAADECGSAGLSVPTIPSEVSQDLRKFTPIAGTSLLNPVDFSPGTFWNPAETSETIKVVASYREIDFLLVHISLVYMFFRDKTETKERLESIIKTSKEIDIPMVLALRTGDTPVTSELFFELYEMCLEGGLPVYPTIGRAAGAVSRLIEYNTWKKK
jgi:acyl-CoA synthetase (NDP forming)